MTISIRATFESDAEALSLMMIASWRSTYTGILSATKLDEICSVWLTPQKFFERAAKSDAANFVAVIDDTIVGHLFAEFSSNATLHIAYLYVMAEFQKQGIGAGLLAKAVVFSSNIEMVTLGVFSDNLGAIDFYNSQGFEIVGMDNPSDWKQGEPTGLQMQKLL